MTQPTTTVKVGDPDPTPVLPEDEYCPASHDGYGCTWPDGHDGQHLAGGESNPRTVMAVWS
jgi:hypothetical protein